MQHGFIIHGHISDKYSSNEEEYFPIKSMIGFDFEEEREAVAEATGFISNMTSALFLRQIDSESLGIINFGDISC